MMKQELNIFNFNSILCENKKKKNNNKIIMLQHIHTEHKLSP